MGIFQLFLEYMFKVEKYRELFVLYNSLVNFLRAFTLWKSEMFAHYCK